MIHRVDRERWHVSLGPAQVDGVEVDGLIEEPAGTREDVAAGCALSLRVEPGGEFGQLASANSGRLADPEPFLLAFAHGRGVDSAVDQLSGGRGLSSVAAGG